MVVTRAIFTLAAIGVIPALSSATPAFPGAEGFGAAATGGRGGRVLYVTNLNTAGPGSFQWALDQDGPRYILFKVSGLINGDVHLGQGDVTIAGQTSPGGIIVRGFDTTEEPYIDQAVGRIDDPDVSHAENWILRHIRTRPSGGSFPDGLRVRYTKNAIVDHCSIANAGDEAVEISFSTNVTIQNSILGETIGGHAQYGGMLINYSNPADGFPLDRLALHHNTWNRAEGRMPEISRESVAAAGSTMDIEISNNLLWDPGYFIDVASTTGAAGGDPVYYRMNWIGNYAYARSSFPYGAIWFPVNSPNASTIFFNDNRINLYPDRTDYGLIYCCNDYASHTPDPTPPSYARSSRHPHPGITYHASSSLRSYMYANAGAFPRDPMDRRLMNPVNTGVIDGSPRDQNPANDAFARDWTTPPAAPSDSDDDGMPDAWETAHGLNPNVQDHNGTRLSSEGYTNLEVYLNELADQLVGGGGGGNHAPVADAGSDRTVAYGSGVTLSGAGSHDQDGDALSYLWEQISGASVSLSDAASQNPAFTAPSVETTLTFRLTVSDGRLSDTDDVSIRVSATGGGGDPVITKITSRRGRPGSPAKIDGSDLASDTNDVQVWFGPARATIVRISSSRIQVRIPRSLRRGATVNVRAVVDGRNSNTLRFKVR